MANEKLNVAKFSPVYGNNIGDLMISKCIEYMADKEDVSVDTYDILLRTPASYSMRRVSIAFRVKVSSFLQFRFPKMFSLIKRIIYKIKGSGKRYSEISSKYDAVIVGGGNIIMDKMGSDYINRVWHICRNSTVPVYIYAAGAGPISNRKIAERIKEKAAFVSVRDFGSQSLIEKDEVHVYYDPAFVISDVSRVERSKKVIGVNVISDFFSLADLRLLASDVANFASEHALGIKIIVTAYPNDFLESQRLSELIREIDPGQSVEIIETSADPESIATAYSDVAFFVGCRMHSLIFSLSYGIPSIGYEWDGKVKEMFKVFLERETVDDFLYFPGRGIRKEIFDDIELNEHSRTVKERVYCQFRDVVKLMRNAK